MRFTKNEYLHPPNRGSKTTKQKLRLPQTEAPFHPNRASVFFLSFVTPATTGSTHRKTTIYVLTIFSASTHIHIRTPI